MKLIVHRGTGTVIDADDDVYVIDTDAIKDEAIIKLLEDGDESDVVEVAVMNGTKITGDDLELNWRNCMAFSPSSLRQEVDENPFVSKKLTEGASEWLTKAGHIEFEQIADEILNDELIWQNYCDIVAHAINEVFARSQKGK